MRWKINNLQKQNRVNGVSNKIHVSNLLTTSLTEYILMDPTLDIDEMENK